MGRLDFFCLEHTHARGVGSLEIGTHWNRSETETCDKKCHSLSFFFFCWESWDSALVCRWMLEDTWSHHGGTGLWSISTLARGQPGFKSPQLSRMPFFLHFTLVYRKMDRLSDPNAGQAWTESWTAAGSLSMDAFQFLTSISGHIAALQRQVPTTTHCWLL